MRKIFEVSNSARVVRVYREDGEFIARLFIDGKHYSAADYFTDSREDAIGTARAMLARQG